MAERRRKKTKVFTNDIKSLLYAYGDVGDPLPETVDTMEDILINFIVDTCHEAVSFAKVTRRQKIKVDDFAFTWRRDPVKYSRAVDLLRLQEDIINARKQFDNSEGKSLKGLKDPDDDEEDLDLGDGVSNVSKDGSTSTTTKKDKKAAEPERKKRKYTKSGKERKPYKKRAKKGETAAVAAASK